MRQQGEGKPEKILEKFNSICVEIPEANYGSRYVTRLFILIHTYILLHHICFTCYSLFRTWTIVLVDMDGNVEYIERTMKEPILLESKNWITTSHSFKITN
jgi:hypothetical protein